MNIRSVASEILPVIGTIGLLGLWLYQQTEIEKKSGQLRQISWARGVYQTYQSHNAVFNAMEELATKNKTATLNIRKFQIYNYELGLSAMEKVLSDTEKTDLPAAKNEMTDIEEDPMQAMDTVQKRLELLQAKLDTKEAAIMQEAAQLRQKYFWSYICFSLLSIMGAFFRISDKFKSTAAL